MAWERIRILRIAHMSTGISSPPHLNGKRCASESQIKVLPFHCSRSKMKDLVPAGIDCVTKIGLRFRIKIEFSFWREDLSRCSEKSIFLSSCVFLRPPAHLYLLGNRVTHAVLATTTPNHQLLRSSFSTRKALAHYYFANHGNPKKRSHCFLSPICIWFALHPPLSDTRLRWPFPSLRACIPPTRTTTSRLGTRREDLSNCTTKTTSTTLQRPPTYPSRWSSRPTW